MQAAPNARAAAGRQGCGVEQQGAQELLLQGSAAGEGAQVQGEGEGQRLGEGPRAEGGRQRAGGGQQLDEGEAADEQR